MNPNITSVANAFYVIAAILGAPSLAASLLYAFFRVKSWLDPLPTASSFDGIKNPDAILMVLGGIEKTMGAVARVVGGLGQFVFGVVAVIATVMLLFALTLFFTGRGLHAHQDWARILGGVLMVGLFVGSLLSMVALRGPLALLSLGLVATSAYALVGLWRGFVA